MAPFSRIQATATEVSRPPEKAMPTRSPTGRLVRTLDTAEVCMTMHGHAKSARGRPLESLSEHVGRLGTGDAELPVHHVERHAVRTQGCSLADVGPDRVRVLVAAEHLGG